MLASILAMTVIGFLAGLGLMFASKKFKVDKDPRIEGVNEILPAANCGGCGYPGCMALAEKIVAGKEAPDSCPVGGKGMAIEIAGYLGIEFAGSGVKKVARVKCRGGVDNSPDKYDYFGPRDCNSITMLMGGNKPCIYGCVGMGSCVKSCNFDAMRMGKDRIPVISAEKCTSCGMCVSACPRKLIDLVDEHKTFVVTCVSVDKGPETKKNCKVGCIACRLCVKACNYEAVTVENNIARINPDKCINCGACEIACPTNAIKDYGKKNK